MKYTLYIIKCLHTGNHVMGVTTDLRHCLAKFMTAGGRPVLTHPEIFHVEQHDEIHLAHQRMQAIRRRWRHHTSSSTFLHIDPLATPPAVAGSSALH